MLGEDDMVCWVKPVLDFPSELRNCPRMELLGKVAAWVATAGQMLAARFHRLRGKHPLAARAGGSGGRTNTARKRS